MISYFRELSESGGFNAADEFQLYLLRFCFGDLVEQEQREMQEYWNAHRIRRSQYAQVAGHPNILYTLPHLTNGEDQLKTFEEDDLELIEEHIAENNTERFMIPPEYKDYFQGILSEFRVAKFFNLDYLFRFI